MADPAEREQARTAWMHENAGADIPDDDIVIAWWKARDWQPPTATPWRVIEERGEFDLELVLANPGLEGTERDVRLVVTWREADDEPEVTTVHPCRECGWASSCGDGCHS